VCGSSHTLTIIINRAPFDDDGDEQAPGGPSFVFSSSSSSSLP
jgi:hypothetical protein